MAGIDTQLARDFRAAMQAQAEQDRAKNGVSIVIGQVVDVVGSTVKLRRMGNDNPDGYPSDLYYNVVGGMPAVDAWVVGLDTLGGVIVMGSGATVGGGGVTDHGALTGLGDDDHTQYHTDVRGDARYAAIAHVGAGGTAHANAVAAGAAGFLTGTDKSKLDGIEANAKDNPSSSEIIGAFTGTPDGTKFLRDDGALAATTGSGFTPPWVKTGASVRYTTWGDGNPFLTNLLLNSGLSPTRTQIANVASPAVLFRLPKALSLGTIYVPTLIAANAATTVNVAIYRRSDSALMTSGTMGAASVVGWSGITISPAVALAANTDYWFVYNGSTSSNTNAIVRTPNVPFDTWIYGSPSTPLGTYNDAGVPIQAIVTVTTLGTWPSTMPAPSSFTPTNRGGMLALLEGTAS